MDRAESQIPGGITFDQTYLSIQPERRGNLPHYIKFAISIGILAILWLLSSEDKWSAVMWRLAEVMAPMGVAELLNRVSFMVDEMKDIHLATRYDKDWTNVVLRVIGSKLEWGYFIVSVMFSIYCFLFSVKIMDWLLYFLIIFARLLLSMTNIYKNAFIVFRCIGKKHSGLFYGNSMAYSYFHGYLNIILPDKGHEGDRHFQDRVDEYVDANRTEDLTKQIDIPDKRLYILIPSSGEAPPNVAHNAEGWMQMMKNLDYVKRNRGGVGERKYHNTMYRIKDPNNVGMRPQYVVAEYATPLITYHEACNHSSSDESWRSFKKDTVISFYETCQDILSQNRSCSNKVTLVYYEDKDELGREVNVAKVLLGRMEEEAASRSSSSSNSEDM